MDQKSQGSGPADREGSEEPLRKKGEEKQAEECRPAPYCSDDYSFEVGM